MSTVTIAIVVLAIAAGLALVLLLASGQAKRKLSSSIPPALRPMYSDNELEGNHLERMMTWGVVLTLFFAIFLPAYWLREPTRAQDKQEGLFARDYSVGEALYAANCATCHGADARGGAAVSPYGDDPWPAPNLLNIVTRYEDSRVVGDVREHIVETLHRGRSGTPMPAWGLAYDGPMTDFQIEAIADWLLANQEAEVAEASPAVNEETGEVVTGEDLYQQNCARCHGGELQGVVGPSLIGVTERHSDETILNILRNGILINPGAFMPPWQEAWLYPDGRYDDDALQRIVDYLGSAQPAELPDGANLYQSPGVGEPLETEAPEAPAADGEDAETDTEGDEPSDDSTEV